MAIYTLIWTVPGRVIVELKTVENLGNVQYAQVRSYLKATGLEVALLVNFSHQRADYRRVEPPPATIPLIPQSPLG